MVRVLVVDDEPEAAELIAIFLRGHGHDAHIATSCREAMRLGEAHRPEVLITDYLLADGTGTDVARALCSAQPALRVLILSGLLPDDIHGACPAYDVKMKPVDLDELAHYVNAAVERQAARG